MNNSRGEERVQDRRNNRLQVFTGSLIVFLVFSSTFVSAQSSGNPGTPAVTTVQDEDGKNRVFRLGEIVEVGAQALGTPGISTSIVTSEQAWTFDKNTLDQVVNIAPGVSSNLDSNGRRNESDIFVRGFGRWQVPMMIDGVRIYLPADNRLDFSRFLTADIAAVQIQKGYASVLDGPGAMGGAINLVTRRPVKRIESEGGIRLSGRTASEAWDAYFMLGTRQRHYYVQASANYFDREFWSLPGSYQPTANSLQGTGRRQSSDNLDWRVNFKIGYTPNDSDEYTFNFTKQSGEKGAPLNIFNNPPVPPNSYWRWPFWDLQNTSFLTNTHIGDKSYLKGKAYYNTFDNGLYAYDDITYSLQSANGRFRSIYDDYAYGAGLEYGTSLISKHMIKGAVQVRRDVHVEQQFNRPTNATLSTIEPRQTQSQNTWSVALEDTFNIRPDVDLVGGISYDKYKTTQAQEFNTTAGLFEYPRGGADAFNWQSAAIWHYDPTGELHASVSNRARFPVIFELYSTRFGSATPNPDLGSESATNIELGWKKVTARGVTITETLFYSDVQDLIQTVVLPDTTTQTQNVGNGHFYGIETGVEFPFADNFRVGGSYTALKRVITDELQPNLRPTGVPTQKAFLYATWLPFRRFSFTPSLDLADRRWSEVNPAPAFPYVRTGSYGLLNLDATYTTPGNFQLSAGLKNAFDHYYELSWGLPQPGRTFYIKAKSSF